MDQLDYYELQELGEDDPHTQYQLGLCCLHGYGIQKDEDRAKKWFRRAAAQGHREAEKMLGILEKGAKDRNVTAQNLAMWCNKATTENDPEAQYAVALYLSEQDDSLYSEEVITYLKIASSQGHSQACMELAKRFLRENNYDSAIGYLKQAVEFSIPEAANLLAYCYSRGLGVEEDPETAEHYLEKEAEWGDGYAKLRLALRYKTGDGVFRSHVNALAYIEKARQTGLTDAQKIFDDMLDDYRKKIAAKNERIRQELAAENARKQQEEQERQEKERREQEQQKKEIEKQRKKKIKTTALRVVMVTSLVCLLIMVVHYLHAVTYIWDIKQSVPAGNNGEGAPVLLALDRQYAAGYQGLTPDDYGTICYVNDMDTKRAMTFTIDFNCKDADKFCELATVGPIKVTLNQGKVHVDCKLPTNYNAPLEFSMSTGKIQSDQWHSLTVTLSRTKQAALYLDGVQVDTGQWKEAGILIQTPVKWRSMELHLGGYQFTGVIAHVSVRNYTLSKLQVKTADAKRLKKLKKLDHSEVEAYYTRLKEAEIAKQQAEIARQQAEIAKLKESAFSWNDHLYKVLELDLTWEEAQEYCRSLGGHLATISSQEENDMLYRLLRDSGFDYGYFGLSDCEQEGIWKWVTEEPLSYTNWNPGEPNNEYGEEDYAMYSPYVAEGNWNDSTDSTGYDSVYICEWEET